MDPKVLAKGLSQLYLALLRESRKYQQEAFYEDGKMRVKPVGREIDKLLKDLEDTYYDCRKYLRDQHFLDHGDFLGYGD